MRSFPLSSRIFTPNSSLRCLAQVRGQKEPCKKTSGARQSRLRARELFPKDAAFPGWGPAPLLHPHPHPARMHQHRLTRQRPGTGDTRYKQGAVSQKGTGRLPHPSPAGSGHTALPEHRTRGSLKPPAVLAWSSSSPNRFEVSLSDERNDWGPNLRQSGPEKGGC